MPRRKRSVTRGEIEKLAREGLSGSQAYERLRGKGAGRKQIFLAKFAEITGNKQRPEKRAERTLAKMAAELAEKGQALTPQKAEEVRARERARYTPKRYAPPSWSVIQRPWTFAEGMPYSYRFRLRGRNRATGRVEYRWVSLLTDSIISIQDAEARLMGLIREYALENIRLTFRNVIESTK